MEKGKKVFVLNTLRIDTYACNYSTTNECVSIYATFEEAKDALALQARVFESIFGHGDRDDINVRVIDDETMKVIISRVFQNDIHEFRGFIQEEIL